MEAFLQNYGLWILLAGVFVAMHWFGMGCCGGRRDRPPRDEASGTPGEEKPASAPTGRGCH